MGSMSKNSIIKGSKRVYQSKQLHRIFESNVVSSKCGNKSAVIFDRQTITYNELNDAANRMAALLLDQIYSRNLQPNEDGDWIIAVCMPPNNDFIVTLLAILKTGAAYLPMDVTFPQNRIDHILEEAKPAMVIYDSGEIERAAFPTLTAFSYNEFSGFASKYDCTNVSDSHLPLSTDVNSLALVLYTSGSTGIPKGVRISHAAILNRLQLQWEQFPFSSTEQFCVFKTVVTFVDSVLEIWGTLLASKTVVVVPKCITKDPSQLITLLKKYKIERLFLVPTLLKSILISLSLKRHNNPLQKLKLWICSGETLPMALANEFFDHFAENEYMLCNFYGCTETMGDVTNLVCRNKDQLYDYANSVPIGVPFFNTTIYILDSERKPVEIGETGELYVSGPSIAQGYVNGRDKDRFIENTLTDDADHSHLYRTGDYASVQKDGIIRYEGRTDSQVKIRGHRVDLSEIQKHLLEIDVVDKAIVLCYHAGQMDQTILAFVSVACELNGKQKLLRTIQIEDYLRNKLVNYMMPQVMVAKEMPLLVNGKIDRQSLLRMYESMNNNDSMIDYDFNGVSQSERQKAGVLFETITEVVGIRMAANLSVESNFFKSGGNSLNAVYTILRLRDRGYAIEIADFIAAENLKEVIDLMDEINHNHEQNLMGSGYEEHFFAEPLKNQHKYDAIHILADAFTERNVIYKYMKSHISYSEFYGEIAYTFRTFVEEGNSFVVKNKDDRIVGVCLNKDLRVDLKKPPNAAPVWKNVKAYYEQIDKLLEDKLPIDKPILEAFRLGTLDTLTPRENIMIVTLMESETIRLAKERNFYAIITNNSNPLTQQLAVSVFGYETLLECQPNKFTINGQKPFESVPDSTWNIMHWKIV